MIFQNTTSYHTSALVLAWVLIWWILPLSAYGFFSRTQTAPEQTLSAGILALTPVTVSTNAVIVAPNSTALSEVTVETQSGSIAAHYDIVSTNVTGALDFCQELFVEIESPDGLLMTSPAQAVDSGAQATFGTLELTFSTTYNSVINNDATCVVEFMVETWNEQVGKGNGFVDSVTFSIPVHFALTATGNGGTADPNDDDPQSTVGTSTGVIINEIFAGPNSDADFPLNTEWIELYNTSAVPVDVEDWSFGEIWAGSEQLHTISVTNTCNPGSVVGFARPVFNTDGTVIPAGGFLLVEPCSGQLRISVSGDTITLYNADGVQQDQVQYGSIPRGQALARVPDGDSDFVIQNPTPNETNCIFDPTSNICGFGGGSGISPMGGGHGLVGRESSDETVNTLTSELDFEPTDEETFDGTGSEKARLEDDEAPEDSRDGTEQDYAVHRTEDDDYSTGEQVGQALEIEVVMGDDTTDTDNDTRPVDDGYQDRGAPGQRDEDSEAVDAAKNEPFEPDTDNDDESDMDVDDFGTGELELSFGSVPAETNEVSE